MQVTDNVRCPGALFATNMVALQLVTVIDKKIYILYDNTLCNSSTSVRPVRHQYIKETKQVTTDEYERLQTEIRQLTKFEWTSSISIQHIGFCTMCDGKVTNAINDNDSTQRCPFCGFGMKDFNRDLTFLADPQALAQLCLCVLHFGIRAFEHVCKVGFNQDFQCWQATGAEKQALKKIRKARIMQKFKDIGKNSILCFHQVIQIV